MYVCIVGYKSLKWFKIPRLSGTVVDKTGQPLENAIVRLVNSETNELALVSNTHSDGSFNAFVEPAEYQVSVIKPGYFWADVPVGSFFSADLRGEPQHLVATMEQI
jgi:hypothetical protein